MNRSLIRTLGVAIAAAIIMSGCETIGPAIGIKPATGPTSKPGPVSSKSGVGASIGKPTAGASPTAQPIAPPLGAEQTGLKDGIELYNKGSYNDAIKRLSAPEVAGGSKATQLQGLKYSAFSYCVSSRQSLCRLSFEKAFKLDPNFDLAPGEHGHPLWGPAFARAKKGGK